MVISIAFALDRSPAAIVMFPVPATSIAAGGFPALRFPVCFMSRVIGPITLGALSAQIDDEPDIPLLEQLQSLVQPLPTPPVPAEAASIPEIALRDAVDLLLYPVSNEAEALAGVSDGEVVHPAPQCRVDQLDYPIYRLGLESPEHILELTQ